MNATKLKYSRTITIVDIKINFTEVASVTLLTLLVRNPCSFAEKRKFYIVNSFAVSTLGFLGSVKVLNTKPTQF